MKRQDYVTMYNATPVSLDTSEFAEHQDIIKKYKIELYVFEVKNHAGWFAPLIFAGRSDKPEKTYRYDSKEKALEAAFSKLKNKINVLQDKEAKRSEHRQNAAEKANEYEIGDVLYNSWGWEQTNIDFYQVVGKKGKMTLIIRPIAADIDYDGQAMGGTTTPKVDQFTGEEMSVRVNGSGGINLPHGWTGKLEKNADGSYQSKGFTNYA